MRLFIAAPEDMPTGGSPSKDRTPNSDVSKSPEDHRLRTEPIESVKSDAKGQRGREKRNNQGKGGKNGKKEWLLDEIDEEYPKWQEELKGYEEGKSTDMVRKAALEQRIAKADAKRGLENKKIAMKALEDQMRALGKEKSDLLEKKKEINYYRKEGAEGLEADQRQLGVLEEKLRSLEEKISNGSATGDDQIAKRDLDIALEKLKGRINDGTSAIALEEDWKTDYDIKIESASSRREQIMAEFQEMKEAFTEGSKAYLEDYGELPLDLTSRDKEPSEPLYINTEPMEKQTSGMNKGAWAAATIAGATIGNMLKMAGSYIGDMWKLWRGYVAKPGSAFGGRGWKEFVGLDKKKK